MDQNTRYSRKKEILEYTKLLTKAVLEEEDVESNALVISIDLTMERSNVSRILNELWRENRLIKIEGRPTNFLHRDYLESIYYGLFFPNSITDVKEFNKIISSSKNKLKEKYFIGDKANESLAFSIEKIKYILNSKALSGFIILYGEKNTGKKYLVESIIDNIKADYNSRKMYYHCNDIILKNLDENEFLEEFDNFIANKRNKILLIKNADVIVSKFGNDYLKAFIEKFSTNNHLNKYICLFNGVPQDQITNNFLTAVSIESFNDRSVLEKFKFVLQGIQQIVDEEQFTISLSKAIISCFVSSRYENNLQQLIFEIRSSVNSAIIAAEIKQSRIGTITFDDLSDSLLNNISDVSEMHNQINRISSFFSVDTLLFVPNTTNQEIITLKDLEISPDGNISSGFENFDSIQQVVKDDLRKNKELYLYHQQILSNDRIFIKINDILSRYASKEENSRINYRIYEAITNTRSIFYERDLEIPNVYINKEIQTKVGNITEELEKELDVTLPINLKFYLEYYYSYININQLQETTSVLVVCHGDKIAEKYAMHINTLKFSHECYYLDYTNDDQSENFSLFVEKITNKINQIDFGGGVVMLTDIAPLTNIDFSNNKSINSKVINIFPITLQLLINIMTDLYSKHKNIFDIENLYLNKKADLEEQDIASQEATIIDGTHYILKSSLNFLDPYKSSKTLLTVYKNIIKSLKIEPDERVMLRFIIHSSFLIERVIRKETYEYKNTKKMREEHPRIYNVIQKEFTYINEYFAILTPNDELARLSELFIELIGVKESENIE